MLIRDRNAELVAARGELIDKIAALRAALERLREHYFSTSGYWDAWVFGSDSCSEARERAMGIFSALHYADEISAQQTSQSYGLIAVPRNVADAASLVNIAKLELKRQVEATAGLLLEGKRPSERERSDALKETIGFFESPRFHLRQAFRTIKILDRLPESFGFTWLRSRDVASIDKSEAIRRLEAYGDNPRVADELARLAGVDDDVPLAIVNPTVPEARMNLVEIVEGRRKRRSFRVNMPVLVVYEPGKRFPAFKQLEDPGELPPIRRRGDRRVEDHAICPTIRVHRYLPGQEPRRRV